MILHQQKSTLLSKSNLWSFICRFACGLNNCHQNHYCYCLISTLKTVEARPLVILCGYEAMNEECNYVLVHCGNEGTYCCAVSLLMQVAVQKVREECRSRYYQKHSLPTAAALHSAAGESPHGYINTYVAHPLPSPYTHSLMPRRRTREQ